MTMKPRPAAVIQVCTYHDQVLSYGWGRLGALMWFEIAPDGRKANQVPGYIPDHCGDLPDSLGGYCYGVPGDVEVHA